MAPETLIESFNAVINLVTVALITRAVRDVRAMKLSAEEEVVPELKRSRRNW